MHPEHGGSIGIFLGAGFNFGELGMCTPSSFFRVGFAAFLLVTVNSCHEPERPDGKVRIVSAFDLAREYHSDPETADLAFTGQVVRVRVTTSKTTPDGVEVHWKLVYRPGVEPVVVFRFSEITNPPFHAPGWIEGTCRGRDNDSKDHGHPDYHFTVTVTGCRAVPAVSP